MFSIMRQGMRLALCRTLMAAVFVLMVGSLLLLGSCGTTMVKKEAPVMEQNLIWAGFVKVTADSSEKLEKLLKLPPYKLVKRKIDGQVAYVYADPTNCKCAYIGRPEQYAAFQQLIGSMNEGEAIALNARMEAQEQDEAIMDSWDPL